MDSIFNSVIPFINKDVHGISVNFIFGTKAQRFGLHLRFHQGSTMVYNIKLNLLFTSILRAIMFKFLIKYIILLLK